MPTEQSQQTLAFFDQIADDWDTRGGFVADARHAYCLAQFPPRAPARLLDLGCGTGSLVLAWARRGAPAEGFDFSPRMIARAEQKRAAEGLPARFLCAAWEDYVPAAPADLIVGNGFIEYLPEEDLPRLLDRAAGWLAPGGSLVLHARNRLFNLFSQNEYTRIEAELGTTGALAREIEELVGAAERASLFRHWESAATRLARFPDHPHTGIGVSRRNQFTPRELVCLGGRHGLHTEEVAGIHFHAFPPAVQKRFPALHREIAERLHDPALADCGLLPQCSSFMIRWGRRG